VIELIGKLLIKPSAGLSRLRSPHFLGPPRRILTQPRALLIRRVPSGATLQLEGDRSGIRNRKEFSPTVKGRETNVVINRAPRRKGRARAPRNAPAIVESGRRETRALDPTPDPRVWRVSKRAWLALARRPVECVQEDCSVG
jgi:hypothetical protein